MMHNDASADSTCLLAPSLGARFGCDSEGADRDGKPTIAERKTALTAREIEVLRWVANGRSASEIGGILHITKRTIDEHVHGAVRKLGALNRTHAVALALRDSIIKL